MKSLMSAATVYAIMGLAMTSTSCQSGSGPQAAAVPESEWEWLFDGASLDKWRGYRMDHVPEAWSIRDSTIYCRGLDAGDLMTKGQWQNFDLRLEWKISEAGNSGIMYRVMEIYDYPYLTGPEFQVLDDAAHPDASNGPTRMAGAVYDVYPPSQDATRPAGEWNDTRILVDSTHVEHWLNGVKIVEYELFGDDWDRRIAESKWAGNPDFGRMIRGHIALQDHSDEVWYRNVRIKALSDTR
jgi:hypothetical protein